MVFHGSPSNHHHRPLFLSGPDSALLLLPDLTLPTAPLPPQSDTDFPRAILVSTYCSRTETSVTFQSAYNKPGRWLKSHDPALSGCPTSQPGGSSGDISFCQNSGHLCPLLRRLDGCVQGLRPLTWGHCWSSTVHWSPQKPLLMDATHQEETPNTSKCPPHPSALTTVFVLTQICEFIR